MTFKVLNLRSKQPYFNSVYVVRVPIFSFTTVHINHQSCPKCEVSEPYISAKVDVAETYQSIYVVQLLFSTLNQRAMISQNALRKIYIPSAWELVSQGGNGSEDRFFFREKVSLSAVVRKKGSCLTDRSSCLPERSEGRQLREVRQSFRP